MFKSHDLYYRLDSDTSDVDANNLNFSIDEFKNAIDEEFSTLQLDSPRKKEVSIDCKCKSKNRYNNIIPIEDTRVRLLDTSVDYINANYISEETPTNIYREHKYIATQGPLESTIFDFWQMIWQNDTEIIIMVCKLYEQDRMKCYKYWPRKNQTIELKAGLSVKHLSTSKVNDDIIVRVLKLEKENESRNVYHIQLSGWPDFGVPGLQSFITFIDLYRQHLSVTKLDGYVVVHCSAGVGRTGTFLAIDIGLNQMLQTGKLCDIASTVKYIRTKRGNMIQTSEQYNFVYHVLTHYALLKNIEINDNVSLFGTIVGTFVVGCKNKI